MCVCVCGKQLPSAVRENCPGRCPGPSIVWQASGREANRGSTVKTLNLPEGLYWKACHSPDRLWVLKSNTVMSFSVVFLPFVSGSVIHFQWFPQTHQDSWRRSHVETYIFQAFYQDISVYKVIMWVEFMYAYMYGCLYELYIKYLDGLIDINTWMHTLLPVSLFLFAFEDINSM